jgi:hypothetical protein
MFEHSEQIRLFQNQYIYAMQSEKERKKQSSKVGPTTFKIWHLLLFFAEGTAGKRGKERLTWLEKNEFGTMTGNFSGLSNDVLVRPISTT